MEILHIVFMEQSRQIIFSLSQRSLISKNYAQNNYPLNLFCKEKTLRGTEEGGKDVPLLLLGILLVI